MDLDQAKEDILDEAKKYLDNEHIEYGELSLSTNDKY
jgi:hypothetical protein